MPGSVRVIRSSTPSILVVASVAPKNPSSEICVRGWGDFRNVIRGSIVGTAFGVGGWLAIFWLLALFRL